MWCGACRHPRRVAIARMETDCRRGNPHCGTMPPIVAIIATDGQADNKARLRGSPRRLLMVQRPPGRARPRRIESQPSCLPGRRRRQGGQYGPARRPRRRRNSHATRGTPATAAPDKAHRPTRHPATPGSRPGAAGDQRVANNSGSMVALATIEAQSPALPPRCNTSHGKRDHRDAITRGRHQRCEQDQNAPVRLLFPHEYRG